MNFLLDIHFTKISFMHVCSICATQSRKRSRPDIFCVDVKTYAAGAFKLKYLTRLCPILLMTPERTINNRKLHCHNVSFLEVRIKFREFVLMCLRMCFGINSFSCKNYRLNSSNVLHNEELNDLYSSPNIVRVIKSRRMRWAGHVARMGGRGGV